MILKELKKIMLESALFWKAIKVIYPDVEIQRCIIHHKLNILWLILIVMILNLLCLI